MSPLYPCGFMRVMRRCACARSCPDVKSIPILWGPHQAFDAVTFAATGTLLFPKHSVAEVYYVAAHNHGNTSRSVEQVREGMHRARSADAHTMHMRARTHPSKACHTQCTRIYSECLLCWPPFSKHRAEGIRGDSIVSDRAKSTGPTYAPKRLG